MLKSKILTGLLILTIVFCLHLNSRSIAGDCDCLEHSKGTPIITGDHGYPADWLCTADPDIEYDTENSSETVARNNSVTVAITGNNKPFTWSVSGTGFTLDNATTEGLTNTLNANGTACGSATITVTGCDGTVVTGYVRCTTGKWGSYTNGCKLSGTPHTREFHYYGNIMIMTKTVGKYSQEQTIGPGYGYGDSLPCSEMNCYSTEACTEQSPVACINCIDCLTWSCADYEGHDCHTVPCGPRCCHVYWDTECEESVGQCKCNMVLRYREWICP